MFHLIWVLIIGAIIGVIAVQLRVVTCQWAGLEILLLV